MVVDQPLDFSGYESIPVQTQAALHRYVENRVEPGSFLKCVLSNDLFGAIGRADDEHIETLPLICRFIYNRVPSPAWGSPTRVHMWLTGNVNIY